MLEDAWDNISVMSCAKISVAGEEGGRKALEKNLLCVIPDMKLTIFFLQLPKGPTNLF
jgi:hypothetical protein